MLDAPVTWIMVPAEPGLPVHARIDAWLGERKVDALARMRAGEALPAALVHVAQGQVVCLADRAALGVS